MILAHYKALGSLVTQVKKLSSCSCYHKEFVDWDYDRARTQECGDIEIVNKEDSMKAKDIIKKLEQFDPEMEVVVEDREDREHYTVKGLKTVKLNVYDDSISEYRFSDLDPNETKEFIEILSNE